ncbi:uncharacterized protein LOC117787833 [Drosophila innubila]|uniref:uncharacterized protein LOC117787833 n=1 Tax=Drosophila innubila TaxID=198719 RepID=UPI00148C5784|nr:uncharacterized protein LOC117787833 [Drosophila innubila]
MAPQQQQQQQQQHQQQNSTFIDDNLDTCPSLLNLPESPILPTKHQHYQQRQNQDNNNNNHNDNVNKPSAERLVDAKVTTTTIATTRTTTAAHNAAPQPGQNQQHDSKANGNGQHTAASRRHRHRSISLYGVNSTVEQGHKEIPIWLDDDEPRYVSGVTNKTTCNDIIKALIDDELRNENANYCNPNNNLPHGGHGAAASRDYSDYVITERWRGIERSYDGNMAILPVWRAWSRVHNELRLSLKKRGELIEPMPLQLMQLAHSDPAKSFSVLKWLKKLLHLTNKKQKSKTKSAKTPAKLTKKTKEKCLLAKKQQEMPDELLLILLPDQHYEAPTDANHNVKTKLYNLAESRATQRRRRRSRCRSRHEPIVITETIANNNCIRRRRKDAPLRNSVRNKLASLHADMNVRYEREYNLTRQLTEKCKLYKQHNELYTSPEMEISVGQLQRNIEAYADDIIKTEHELLELKNEIKHDISLINNLKRLTLEQETPAQSKTKFKSLPNDGKNKDCMKMKEETPQVAKNVHEMQFVDNIYEFCDNNASMLV